MQDNKELSFYFWERIGAIMGILAEIQNRIKSSGLLIFCALLSLYFIFHGISGDRGLLKLLYLRNEISEAKQIANTYHQEKAKLEEKVKLLSSSSLDLDLLDERARVVLNLIDADEFVILDSNEDN